jgi:Ca-activated chloride channel family protein
MDAHLSLSTAVVLTPCRAGLCAGTDNTAEVLVRIQAPDAPAGHRAERPPQAVALVIDRSGSMEGRPISEARRCAQYVVGKLRPTDTVSLVQFDNRVQRLWPAVPLGDGAPLRAAIAGIHCGGSTNLHGGWRDGADSLSDLAGSGLKRVILLSDGQANQGLTDAAAIDAQCAELAARGVTTSTYGLGNSFNEELMVAMARAGGGNSYYGDTAEDLMDPFQQELELLGNLCLRDLRLSATVPDGVALQMVNELAPIDGGWRLPDLAWGAEAWAVLRLSVPAGALPPTGQMLSLLRVAVDGQSLEGEPVALERGGLALPVMSAPAYEALAQDELVARRLVELAAAEALSSIRAAAGREDWTEVDLLLAEATRRFEGNAWVSSMLAAMAALAASRSRDRTMKESMYASIRLSTRLTPKEENVDFQAEADSIAMPAFLRRKTEQGKGKGKA